MVLKRIGTMSLAKVFGVLYAAIGLLAGVFMALISLAGAGSSQAGFGMGMGIAAVIVLPVLYGVLGFIGGLLTAWLFNLAAGWVGGVELDLE